MSQVIMLTNRLPYPVDDGWKSRAVNVLRAVAARLPTTLVTFHPPADTRSVRALEAAVGHQLRILPVMPPKRHSIPRVALGALTRTPLQVWDNRSRQFQRAVDSVVDQDAPTVGIAVCTFMYPYLLPHTHLRRVIDTHNVDSLVLERYAGHLPGVLRRRYAHLTAAKTRRLEASAFRDAHEVWVCSEEERRLLLRRNVEATVRVVPNGVDTQEMDEIQAGGGACGRLLFFGKLDYLPNLDAVEFFVRDVLPLVRRKHAGAELHIVGRGAPRAMRRLCDAHAGVTLIGPVKDIRSALREAQVVVVPLRMGGGTRLKILEALAARRAVVSTEVGAEGLQLKPGRDLLVADGPAPLAEAVSRLLSTESLRVELGTHGRATVCEQYDWRAVSAGIELEPTV